MPIIETNTTKRSAIFTEGFKVDDALVDYGYRKHFSIKHSPNEFTKGYNQLNSIESFWGYCKVRFVKIKVIRK